MKTFLLTFLLLTLPLSAKPTKPVPTPELAPTVPMARQRTVQEDDELRDWIVGIQTLAQDAQKRADEAETEAKASRDQSAIAGAKLEHAVGQLSDLQIKYNGVEVERDQAIAQRDVEHKARVAAEAHVSKIKTYLGFALGGLLALAAEYLLSSLMLPPPFGVYVRIGAPVLAFGLGWAIVARMV